MILQFKIAILYFNILKMLFIPVMQSRIFCIITSVFNVTGSFCNNCNNWFKGCKLRNNAFIIKGDSSAIMNAILRSLSVIYGSVY